jgi:hypothetical protein
MMQCCVEGRLVRTVFCESSQRSFYAPSLKDVIVVLFYFNSSVSDGPLNAC